MSFDVLGNPVILLSLFELERGVATEVTFDDLRNNLESFEFDEDTEKVGELTLTFDNPDGRYDEDERLQGRDKFIEVRWGYLTHLSPPKTCVIRYVLPRYQANGQIKLKIVAWDAVSRAFINAHPRNWGRVSTSSIAQQIAYRWNLLPIVPVDSDDVRMKPYIQPGKMSDLQFLKALARRRGWVCHSDGLNLYYGPDSFDDTPDLLAVYGAGQFNPVLNGAPLILKSFEPQLDQNKRASTRRVGIDPVSKATNTAKKKDSDESNDPSRKSLANSRVIATFGSRQAELGRVPESEAELGGGTVTPSAEKHTKQMEKDTEAAHWNIKQKAATANAVFEPGNPELRVRRIVDVQGVALTHSGRWKITGAKHKINANGGYTVSCGFKRDSKNTGDASAAARNQNTNKKATQASSDLAPKVKEIQVDISTRTVSRVTRTQ